MTTNDKIINTISIEDVALTGVLVYAILNNRPTMTYTPFNVAEGGLSINTYGSDFNDAFNKLVAEILARQSTGQEVSH